MHITDVCENYTGGDDKRPGHRPPLPSRPRPGRPGHGRPAHGRPGHGRPEGRPDDGSGSGSKF